jgi:hypothetical protein
MAVRWEEASASICAAGLASDHGRTIVRHRISIGVSALAAALALSIASVHAFDETRYPNWKGQWLGAGPGSSWDPSGQQAPLTPEYQASFAASIKSAAEGGIGPDPTARCVPAGVPRVMMATQPMEIVITPNITYLIFEEFSTLRQVYTDGRKFPDYIEPTFTGYSTGQWQDTTGNGRFDTLLVETRGIKGPMPAAFRSTTTVKPSSPRSSTRTKAMRTFCTMRSRLTIMH